MHFIIVDNFIWHIIIILFMIILYDEVWQYMTSTIKALILAHFVLSSTEPLQPNSLLEVKMFTHHPTKKGVGTPFCATPGCNMPSSENMLFCDTCLLIIKYEGKIPCYMMKDGIGNTCCATPGCNMYAAPNMLLCDTCIALQQLGDASPLNRLQP